MLLREVGRHFIAYPHNTLRRGIVASCFQAAKPTGLNDALSLRKVSDAFGRGEFRHAPKGAWNNRRLTHWTRSNRGYQAQSCTYLAPPRMTPYGGAPPARGILRDSATFSSDSFDDTFRRKPHINSITTLSPADTLFGKRLQNIPMGRHSRTPSFDNKSDGG